MEVLSPGYFMAPVGKKGVVFVDNTGKQPSEYGHTICKDGKYVSDTTFETSSLPFEVVNYMSAYLGNENYYKNVKVAPESWLKPSKNIPLGFLRPDPLNNEQKNAIRDSSDADLLISLDKLVISTKTDVKMIDSYFRSSRDVMVNSVWRIIDLNADTLCLQFQHNDSLYWERWDIAPTLALRQLPGVEETIPEIADYVADNIYRIFGPYWKKINRNYYVTGGYRMSLAADRVLNNDWDGAAVIWQDEYNKGFGRSPYRAAMNMMLYYEYLDKPEEAVAWGEKAKLKMDKGIFKGNESDRQVLSAYIEYLNKRKVELSELNIVK